MTLGKLIALLESWSGAKKVVFSDGRVPAGLASWRGVYSNLTIFSGPSPMTVCRLLACARQANGSTFDGYKGGEYVMGHDTPVWADEWGECDHIGIVGHRSEPDALVLLVADLSDYRGY